MSPIDPSPAHSGRAADGVDNPVLIDQVVARLQELILSGHFGPGEKVREQALAEKMGISRGPLREAIRTLEGKRWLTRTPRTGVRVVGLSIQDLDEIMHVREALEGLAARQAAENMTVAEIDALRETLLRLERRPQDLAEAVATGSQERDFHRLVARGSRNHWLQTTLEDLFSLVRLYRVHGARQPHLPHSLAEHQVIVDRIHARDAAGAESAMRDHMSRSRGRMVAHAREALRAGHYAAVSSRRGGR